MCCLIFQKGNTPLHAACEKGNLEIVKILLEHGAEKDAENVDGFTPLLRACTNGHLFVIKELAARGANIYKTTKVTFLNYILIAVVIKAMFTHQKYFSVVSFWTRGVPNMSFDWLSGLISEIMSFPISGWILHRIMSESNRVQNCENLNFDLD